MLRLRRDREHNDNCPISQRIFVKRLREKNPSEEVSCLSCGGMILRREFARHNRMCTHRPPNMQHVTRSQLNPHRFGLIDERMTKFLGTMKDDHVKNIILHGKAIFLLAETYAYRHGTSSALKKW